MFSVSDSLFKELLGEINEKINRLHQLTKSPDFTKKHKAEFAWLLMSFIHLAKSCLNQDEINVAIDMGSNLDTVRSDE